MNNLPISNNEKLVIFSELATMLTAGIPIVEALDSIKSDSKGNSKKVLENIIDDINQGSTISDSLEKLPMTFDPIVVNLVRAAEESGTLEVTLKDISKSIKKDMDLSEKVKSALVYPAMIMMVFTAVFILILTFVIPKVASVFTRLKVDLPLPTRILILISDLFLSHTITIIIISVLLLLSLIFIYKTKKRELMSFISNLPLISNLSKEIDFTRFSHTMHLLLTAGIPITKALELSQSVVTKKSTAKAIENSKELVTAGHQLSEGFKKHKNIFPGIMMRITEVGERSGSLEKSMQDLSEYFENKVSNSLKNLTVMLEPLLILIVGVLVGGMMLAIVAPIYQLIGQINNR